MMMIVIVFVAYNFIKKESLAQVFSCEFYGISKKIFLYRTLLVAASGWLTNENVTRNYQRRNPVHPTKRI